MLSLICNSFRDHTDYRVVGSTAACALHLLINSTDKIQILQLQLFSKLGSLRLFQQLYLPDWLYFFPVTNLLEIRTLKGRQARGWGSCSLLSQVNLCQHLSAPKLGKPQELIKALAEIFRTMAEKQPAWTARRHSCALSNLVFLFTQTTKYFPFHGMC